MLFHLPGKSRFLDFPQKGIYNIGDRAKNLLIFFGHFFSAKCTFAQVEREDEGETDLKSSHVCELTNFYLSPPLSFSLHFAQTQSPSLSATHFHAKSRTHSVLHSLYLKHYLSLSLSLYLSFFLSFFLSLNLSNTDRLSCSS